MSIAQQFQGATLRKPGAYSYTTTASNGAGAQSTTGVLFILGEADAGPGGAVEGIQTYSAAAFSQMVAKYIKGPILDVAKAALAPSRTPGINGAQTFLIWKTNNSTQASYGLLNTYGTVTAEEYGIGGNRITYKATTASESALAVTGSAPVTAFADLHNKTILLSINGAAPVTVTFDVCTNMADVTASFSAVTALTASSTGGALTLTLNPTSNHHRDGFGHSFAVVSGSALADLFLTAATFVTPTTEPQTAIELLQPRDSTSQTGVIGGAITMQIGRTAVGSCTAANVTTTATAMTITQTGATPSSLTFNYSAYPTIGNLADAITNVTGWSCTVAPATRNTASTTLDQVTAVGAFSATSKPARLKSDVNAVKTFFAAATLAAITTTAVAGLPDSEGRVNLANGVRGATASSAFDAGLTASLTQTYNVAVPAISQDATVDTLAGLTDATSSYDIETVHAMLAAHLDLRGNIQNKREAQGVVGYRVPTKAAAFAQAAALNDANVQLCMEDVLIVDSSRTLAWNQPHVFAGLIAGMRCGSPVGEPLTHKYLSISGVGHYVNASTGAVGGDYSPLVDYDAAIVAGVTSSEPANGAQRVMVDNTTYGIDASFLYNRGSVVEASQYITQTVRTDAELAFVGRKTAAVTASAIKNRIRTTLTGLYNAQITATSDDAPQGFVESTFTVTVNGNTATVNVEAKPTQGLDFLLINFTMGESSTSA